MRVSKNNNPEAYVKPKEFYQLLEKTETLRDYTLVTMLWYSVRRINEILHVKVKHVNFERNMIQITILKQARKRVEEIPLFGDLRKVLWEHIQYYQLGEEDYIFQGNVGRSTCDSFNYVECSGGHLSDRRVRTILEKLCEKTFGEPTLRGLSLHPHRFRKSFGFNIARKHIAEDNIKNIDDVKWGKIKLVQRATRDVRVTNAVKYFDTLLEAELDQSIQEEFENIS